jgi:hypothetical protein
MVLPQNREESMTLEHFTHAKIEGTPSIASLSLELSFPSDVCDFGSADRLTNPKLRKSFTRPEDVRLAGLVDLHGPTHWELISRSMDGRSARQCRERWRTFLAPAVTNGPWSRAEDLLLTRLFEEHGPNWSFIAKQVHGRSDSNGQNRWVRHLMAMQQAPAEPPPPPAEDPAVSDLFDLALDDPVDSCSLFRDGFINW